MYINASEKVTVPTLGCNNTNNEDIPFQISAGSVGGAQLVFTASSNSNETVASCSLSFVDMAGIENVAGRRYSTCEGMSNTDLGESVRM